MTRYKYYQPNKKDIKDKYGDCVFRALTKVLGKTWLDIFDDLTPIAREMQCPMTWKNAYELYLQNNGFKYTGVTNKKGSTRPTVQTFAEKHKQGTYFLRVAHHVVACVDGYYYDTLDSGYKSLYGYWTK